MTEVEIREFDLGDILSITTERLLSERGTDGIYDILNYMTQDNLWTHQLPRAGRECAPVLREQFPQLCTEEVQRDVEGICFRLLACGEVRSVCQHMLSEWLEAEREKLGASFKVKPLAQYAHTFQEPYSELVDMVGADKIIAVEMPPTEDGPE